MSEQVLEGTVELGNKVATYKHNPAGALGPWGLFASLIGLVFGPFMWFQTVQTVSQDGLGGLVDFQLIVATIIGTALFLLGVGVVLGIWRGRHDHLTLYADGFVYREGNATYTRRWNDIEMIHHAAKANRDAKGRYHNTVHTYTVFAPGLTDVRLTNDLDNIAEIGEKVQRKVRERLLPLAKDRFDRGESERFGHFEINQQGITYAGALCPWEQIEGVSLGYQTVGVFKTKTEVPFISIKQKGSETNRLDVLVEEIPNYMVMFFLIRHALERTAVVS